MVTPPWQAVAALVDPVRRALYDHVRTRDHPVTREEAAEATGISRNLAAHHLDKLVEAGLLRTRYQHPAARPRGRGRTPKVYEPTGNDVAFSFPARRYELAARILTDAIAESPGDARTAACAIAERYGVQLGRQAAGSGADLTTAYRVLSDLGFSPSRPRDDVVLLGNCPFRALARRHPDLVCALNHALLAGVLTGLGAGHLVARFAPRPGACCVEIHTVADPGHGAQRA